MNKTFKTKLEELSSDPEERKAQIQIIKKEFEEFKSDMENDVDNMSMEQKKELANFINSHFSFTTEEIK